MNKKLLSWSLILTCVAVFWIGLLNHQQTIGSTDNARLIHTIERLSFGLAPGDLKKIKNTGLENYIQSQLNPRKTKKNSALKSYLANLDTVNRSSSELFKEFRQYSLTRKQQNDINLTIEKKEKLRKKGNQLKRKATQQAQDAHLMQSILSPNQLQEVMVDFWFNHFNVLAPKKLITFWLAGYEQDIREHALGNFRDLLGVTAHSPAMLFYLDNDLNRVATRNKKKGLNENYARELMELHTLGVNGGYTQKDVIALARIFTGWSVDRTGNSDYDNNFRFYENKHDYQDKIFLEKVIKGTGIDEGEQALDILATHPATAEFISYKLAQYFVADEPPKTLVNKLQKEFLDSQGNIKDVLNVLFHSEAFNDPQYYEQKFKTPYQYLVSLVRASGITSPNLKFLMAH